MTSRTLDSNIALEGDDLQGALGDDPDEMQILGYLTMYTSGSDWNVLVPHDWLADRASQLGLPDWLVPNNPRPSSAYKRTIKRLREDSLSPYSVTAPRRDTGNPDNHPVSIEIRSSDTRNLHHIHASVYFDASEAETAGGEWVDHRLGHFRYSSDHKVLVPRKHDDLDEDDLLFPIWESVYQQALEVYHEMRETHIGGDIRKMMYYTTRDYTNKVVPLRDGGAVYFFPAGMTDFLDAMSTLYDEIDAQFKTDGVAMAVRTVPILDTDEQREWIRSRVEKALDQSISRVLEDAFEDFDEGGTADEVIKSMREALGDDAETAEAYNALLEAELTIEEQLKKYRDSVDDDEKQDIIDRAIAQTDIDQF